MRKQPVLTYTLIGINVAVFLLMLGMGVSPMAPSVGQLLHWGADWGPLSLGSQPWRMLTSNYVHNGLIHILMNMWCLFNLGRMAENVLDRWTYGLVYTACGLAGSIVSLWWHPQIIVVGASGAIFGLAGALIAILYLGKLPIPPEAIRKTMSSLLLFAGYNLLFGMQAGVDNSAHIGGLLAGIALGLVLAPSVTKAPELRRIWSVATLTGMAIVLLAATLFLRGQSSVDSNLKTFADAFVDARNHKDVAKLKALVAPESLNIISSTFPRELDEYLSAYAFQSIIPDSYSVDAKPVAADATLPLAETAIYPIRPTQRLALHFVEEPDKIATLNLNLVQENNHWLLVVPVPKK